MKKYRMGYDFLFLPNETFVYKKEKIGAMAINVLFKVFSDEGERLFETDCDNFKDQPVTYCNGEPIYLSELIICSFDRKEIFTFNPNISLIRNIDFSVSWEIDSYWKDIDKGILEPEEITEKEFMDIMNRHIDLFDNSDNRFAQTTSYFTKEVIETEVR